MKASIAAACFVVASTLPLVAQSPERLEWSNELKPVEDRSALMVQGIHRFADRLTLEAVETRQTISADSAKELAQMIGVIDERATPAIEYASSWNQTAELGATSDCSIFNVRWPVLKDTYAEGLLIRPKSEIKGLIVLVPDCETSPEALMFSPAYQSQASRVLQFAKAGYVIIVPALLNRDSQFSGNPDLGRKTNLPHREWIYRQSYQMGRHVIGYEVQSLLQIVDWAKSNLGQDLQITFAGHGEGAHIALYSAALDARINHLWLSGSFAPNTELWKQPIDRNVFGLIGSFGPAELASMSKAAILIEYSPFPSAIGQPTPTKGQRAAAAPGSVSTPDEASVKKEIGRIKSSTSVKHLRRGDNWDGFPSSKGAASLASALGIKLQPISSLPFPLGNEAIKQAGIERQERLVHDWSHFTQQLMERSASVRDGRFWKKVGKPNAAEWSNARKIWQKEFHDKIIGKLNLPASDQMVGTKKFKETEKWTGYEVVLKMNEELFAWGYLLIPKNIPTGDKRPVVVCQHGLEGLPEHVIEDDQSNRAWRAYKAYGGQLADRGYVVFAPHNPYRGKDDFRSLQRKLNPLGLSLFSVIVEQHRRILGWLSELPYVDENRIAFYGLSYGGKSAMRIPALLDQYCLSICSADFNEWIRKNVTIHEPYSYMFTGEYEMFEFNLGETYSYAEMAALIAPRPFMVERGHSDGVGIDEWVAWEFARVRRFYTRMGIPERTTIEYFDGPHTINGKGTFKFLDQHLDWSPQ